MGRLAAGDPCVSLLRLGSGVGGLVLVSCQRKEIVSLVVSVLCLVSKKISRVFITLNFQTHV